MNGLRRHDVVTAEVKHEPLADRSFHRGSPARPGGHEAGKPAGRTNLTLNPCRKQNVGRNTSL